MVYIYIEITVQYEISLCSRSNDSISDQIFESVKKFLVENSNYNVVSVHIISGQEEAVAGWIAGNYLSRALENSVSNINLVLQALSLRTYST